VRSNWADYSADFGLDFKSENRGKNRVAGKIAQNPKASLMSLFPSTFKHNRPLIAPV
jgi:hypothetical protein